MFETFYRSLEKTLKRVTNKEFLPDIGMHNTNNHAINDQKKVNGKERTIEEEIFDKSSDQISQLVNKIWLCRYLQCCYLIYDDKSQFKLHFETLCDSYGIKRKPTTIKNPQANAICECVHQVLGTMMRTSEFDMADSVEPADIDTSLTMQHGQFAQHTTEY